MRVPAPDTQPCIARLLKERFCSSWKGRTKAVLSCKATRCCKVEALDAASVPESQVTLSQEQQFSPLQFGGTSRTVIKDSLAMSRSALLG